MNRIALIALASAISLFGCAAHDGGRKDAAPDIFVPQGEFDTVTVTAPLAKEVHCPTCDKMFAVRLVRGEAKTPQDIVVPSGESFGPIGDAFDATVTCPMCQKQVDVRVHRHAAPGQ